MLETNLTSDQLILIRQLLHLVQQSGGQSQFTFKQGECRCEFWVIGKPEQLQCRASYDDIKAIAKADAIRWTPEAPNNGCVIEGAYEIVSRLAGSGSHMNINNSGSGNVQVATGNHNVQRIVSGATSAEMLAQLTALTAELVGTLKVALSPDQASAVERDARDIAEELSKPDPDLVTVGNKTQGIWRRIGAAFDATANVAENVGKIADALGKFAPWVAVVAAACR